MWGTVEGPDAVNNLFELSEDRHQLLHSSDGAWLFKWWGARDIQSIILNRFCLDFILIHLWPKGKPLLPFNSGLVSSSPSNIDRLKFHPVHLITTKKLEWLEHYQSFTYSTTNSPTMVDYAACVSYFSECELETRDINFKKFGDF